MGRESQSMSCNHCLRYLGHDELYVVTKSKEKARLCPKCISEIDEPRYIRPIRPWDLSSMACRIFEYVAEHRSRYLEGKEFNLFTDEKNGLVLSNEMIFLHVIDYAITGYLERLVSSSKLKIVISEYGVVDSISGRDIIRVIKLVSEKLKIIGPADCRRLSALTSDKEDD
jgi:hypothetical protein